MSIPLTKAQLKVIADLRKEDAPLTAGATKRRWEKGEGFWLDERVDFSPGLRRRFAASNRQALKAGREAAEKKLIDRTQFTNLDGLATHGMLSKLHNAGAINEATWTRIEDAEGEYWAALSEADELLKRDLMNIIEGAT